jgi:hypothetical protein
VIRNNALRVMIAVSSFGALSAIVGAGTKWVLMDISWPDFTWPF